MLKIYTGLGNADKMLLLESCWIEELEKKTLCGRGSADKVLIFDHRRHLRQRTWVAELMPLKKRKEDAVLI